MSIKSIPIWLIVTVWVLAACAGKPDAGSVSESAAPGVAQTAISSVLVGTGCYASIPLMAGSQEDAHYQADTNATILAMGGKTDWFPGERMVFSTFMSTDSVVENFKAAMPQNGWEESSNIPGKNWGFVRWKKEGYEAQLLTGQFDKTVFILGCLQFASTPTPIPVAALTMKASFDLLGKVSGLNDLAFYGYQAYHVKEDGLAKNYTISGYSKSSQKFCYLQADEQKVELTCRVEGTPDDPLVEDLSTLKDSPQMMLEAFHTLLPFTGWIQPGCQPYPIGGAVPVQFE